MKPMHISSVVPSPQVMTLGGLFGLRGLPSELSKWATSFRTDPLGSMIGCSKK